MTHSSVTTDSAAARPPARTGPHWAWVVAAVTFVTLVGAAAFRSVPGVLMDPLHDEFGWSHGTIGAAVSVNLVLFGLFSPFAAALMDRFGVRRVVANALILVAAGSGLTVFMGEAWQLVLLWGVLVGVGTGSMSMALVATITSRWFVARRGLVSGVLTAGSATGQLIFLPIVAHLATAHGWRTASLVTAATAFAVVPLVLLLLRDHPADMGLTAYGATDADPGPPPHVRSGSSATRALSVLRTASQSSTFWLLAGGFAICGMSTNGLVATHFVPAAHDHGMPTTTAAGLLAVVGIFDVAGTVLSGWLTDRWDPRLLLARVLRAARGGPDDAAGAARPAPAAEHLGVHRHLRPGLGGDRAAHGDAVPRPVRGGHRSDRLRLDLRRPPDRSGHRRVRRRCHPGLHRQLRRGVLDRGHPVPGRRRPVVRDPADLGPCCRISNIGC